MKTRNTPRSHGRGVAPVSFPRERLAAPGQSARARNRPTPTPPVPRRPSDRRPHRQPVFPSTSRRPATSANRSPSVTPGTSSSRRRPRPRSSSERSRSTSRSKRAGAAQRFLHHRPGPSQRQTPQERDHRMQQPNWQDAEPALTITDTSIDLRTPPAPMPSGRGSRR